jgi:hypothetical protein
LNELGRKLAERKVTGEGKVISAMSGKVEEYARKLEEYEQKKAEKAAKLDVKALVQSSREIRRVEVEGLGVVEYGVLTLADSLELGKV